jgi:hypothetical protein
MNADQILAFIERGAKVAFQNGEPWKSQKHLKYGQARGQPVVVRKIELVLGDEKANLDRIMFKNLHMNGIPPSRAYNSISHRVGEDSSSIIKLYSKLFDLVKEFIATQPEGSLTKTEAESDLSPFTTEYTDAKSGETHELPPTLFHGIYFKDGLNGKVRIPEGGDSKTEFARFVKSEAGAPVKRNLQVTNANVRDIFKGGFRYTLAGTASFGELKSSKKKLSIPFNIRDAIVSNGVPIRERVEIVSMLTAEELEAMMGDEEPVAEPNVDAMEEAERQLNALST